MDSSLLLQLIDVLAIVSYSTAFLIVSHSYCLAIPVGTDLLFLLFGHSTYP